MTHGSLFEYGQSACTRFGRTIKSATIFAKFLTSNDDSGRHGVLVPSEAYEYFPFLDIPDPTQNATRVFNAFDLVSGKQIELAYKYYQRYPERRITRLNGKFNNVSNAPVIALFLKVKHDDGSIGYYVDCVNSADASYAFAVNIVFGAHAGKRPGSFVVSDIEAPAFAYDEPLSELTALFDEVCARGWIESLRTGDTGIGYTFESLVGIKENNKPDADYKGIEVKCKQKKDGRVASGKINLFQKGPDWQVKMTAKERIKQIGSMNEEGRLACYSQLTTTPNNLALSLGVRETEQRIDLHKNVDVLGHWPYRVLEKCLTTKHSRAVFIKADICKSSDTTYYRYDELIYCERPSIRNFIDLVEARDLVFEFTMSQKEDGAIRNHGYPWRLNREELLTELFALRIQLR